LYDKPQTTLLFCPEGKIQYTIPNSVTIIWDRAFARCEKLTSVTIPESVTTIMGMAFYGCSALISIILPNSVTTIEAGTFNFCSALTSVSFGNNVSTIEWSAFAYCSSLTSVNIPNSVTTIGNYAFYKCKKIDSVTIPNSVTYIGERAFLGCSALTSIAIPNSVTTIKDSTFSYCEVLYSITIPNSVTTIGTAAFHHCKALSSITIFNLVPIKITPKVFSEVNVSTITLEVPTSALLDYQKAEVWMDMNIVGGGVLVNPVPSDPEKGYTEGDGLYNIGGKRNEIATIKAIPRNGYKFVNWTVDGTEVSRKNPYSFTVTEDIKLVANFEEKVSIKQVEIDNEITVFPNPTTGELRIESGELRVENVEIFDIHGRNLLFIISQEKAINISHFPAGIYFVKIQTESCEVVKKVLKE